VVVSESACRLTVQDDGAIREALLDGSPDDLRALADMIETSDESVVVAVSQGTRTVCRRWTDDGCLRVSVEAGPVLVLEGNRDAIGIVTSSMRSVANEADALASGPIRRHQHIEYLGETDQWRAPDSFPPVIGSDWPVR
jgi:hypothetical protein